MHKVMSETKHGTPRTNQTTKRRAKKSHVQPIQEGREMTIKSESDKSEPKTKTIWICPKCGWVRPENFSSKNCGKCGSTLITKVVKEDCFPAIVTKTETEIASAVYAQPCEMAKFCPSASDQCKTPLPYTSEMRTIPARRWIDCWAYRTQILGLTFNKELGIYHLKECPTCGQDLIKVLKKNLEALK
jgi:hypothetical protein